MSVHLVLLACGAAFNVFAHELREAQPPKLRGNELASFEICNQGDWESHGRGSG